MTAVNSNEMFYRLYGSMYSLRAEETQLHAELIPFIACCLTSYIYWKMEPELTENSHTRRRQQLCAPAHFQSAD